jgi:hypothetical protein
MAEERFLIHIMDSVSKPQQATMALDRQLWDVEWSTSSGVSMRIDSFNLTVAKISMEGNKRRAEEYWRVTGIPGHARKIRYGLNLLESTSTPPKVLTDGIYAVKISGMSAITEGMLAETGVGIAVVKLIQTAGGEKSVTTESMSGAPETGLRPNDESFPVTITNEALKNLLALTEDDEFKGDESP